MAALVLLVALTLLAVYYINTHPTVAPPFYLMQVRKTTSGSTTSDFDIHGLFYLHVIYDTCSLMFVCCLVFVVCSDAPITTGPRWSSGTRAASPVTLRLSSGVTRRKDSLKPSSAAKGPAHAGHSQMGKGHLLEDCNSTTRGWTWRMEAHRQHRMCLLAPRRLDTVYYNYSCNSLPSYGGFAILSKWLEVVKWLCKCTKNP